MFIPLKMVLIGIDPFQYRERWKNDEPWWASMDFRKKYDENMMLASISYIASGKWFIYEWINITIYHLYVSFLKLVIFHSYVRLPVGNEREIGGKWKIKCQHEATWHDFGCV
jgi:hypothetical protein